MSLIRLRGLLSIEAKLYQQELTNDFKTKVDEELKSREQRLLGLKAERERHRLKFVEEMKVHQLMFVEIKLCFSYHNEISLSNIFRNNCDEIRPYLRQKLQDECKTCQRLQIEDNNLKKIQELDQDRMWFDVQKQVFNQMVNIHLPNTFALKLKNNEF